MTNWLPVTPMLLAGFVVITIVFIDFKYSPNWKKILGVGYVFFVFGWTLMIHKPLFSVPEYEELSGFFWSIRPIVYETEYVLFLFLSPLILMMPLVWWGRNEILKDLKRVKRWIGQRL